MAKELLVSAEYLQKMKDELDTLKTEGRQDIIKKLQKARAFGDLSENSEYDEAKNEQAELEAKILKLDEDIRNAKIIKENTNTDFVSVGNTVTYLCKDTNEKLTFKIVGTSESDPFNGYISNECPVGKALIDKKLNELCDVHSPDGNYKIKVLDIA